MLGLSWAKRLDWSDGWLANAALLVTLAPVAAFVLLLLVSAIGCGMMIAFERFVLRGACGCDRFRLSGVRRKPAAGKPERRQGEAGACGPDGAEI